jgi:hypothetical protein
MLVLGRDPELEHVGLERGSPSPQE